MASDNVYTEGEKILCYHGPLIYEAKCLKLRTRDGDSEFMVHYQGWNKNWDEWVPESRILKFNDANLAKQKELQESHKDNRKRGKNCGGAKTPKPSKDGKSNETRSEGSVHDPDSRSSTPSVEGKSRSKEGKIKTKGKDLMTELDMASGEIKSEDQIKTETLDEEVEEDNPDTDEILEIPAKIPKPDPVLQLSDIRFDKVSRISNPENGVLKMPENLMLCLTDDHYQINRLKRLINLPSPATVCDLLKEFQQYIISKNPDCDQEAVQRRIADLEDYFCACLGAFLLFKCERPQYADILEAYPRRRVSTIYGPIHFLRLLVKTSSVLELIPAAAVKELLESFNEIIEFLSINEKKYFSPMDYGIAAPEYHRRMM